MKYKSTFDDIPEDDEDPFEEFRNRKKKKITLEPTPSIPSRGESILSSTKPRQEVVYIHSNGYEQLCSQLPVNENRVSIW
jgi:hypothetical protein